MFSIERCETQSRHSGQISSSETPLWGGWRFKLFCHKSAFPCYLLSRVVVTFLSLTTCKTIFCPILRPNIRRHFSLVSELVTWCENAGGGSPLFGHTSLWIRVNNHLMRASTAFSDIWQVFLSLAVSITSFFYGHIMVSHNPRGHGKVATNCNCTQNAVSGCNTAALWKWQVYWR